VVDYVGLSGGSVVLFVGAVLAAWLLWGMFVDAHRSLGWVVACAVVALMLHPVVSFLSRRLPRPLAILSVLLAVVGILGLLGVGVVTEVTDSLEELVAAAPEAAAGLEDRYDWAADIGVAERVDRFVSELDQRIRDSAVSEAASTLPTYVVTGILMLFFLVGGHRYIDGFLGQLREPRQTHWRSIMMTGARNGRGWLAGSLGVALVVGLTVGAAAWIADLPAVVSMGLIAGVLSIVPFVGIAIGGLPVVLLAFGFEGWPAGIAISAVLIGLQLADALVARPALERRTVRVGVTVPLVVALVGFELYGIGGAMYSVAVAVLGLAALDAAGYRVDDNDDLPDPALADG
jgi:predicted PurR-regulated permease PerM